MRRRKKLLVLFCAAMTVGALATFFALDRQPYCDGHSLGYWVDLYEKRNDPHAAEAIVHIGTNSFSTVIRWLKSTDPTYKQRLSGLWYNIPVTVRPAWVERWVLARPAEDDYRRATCVLALLGEKADSIQPQLLKLTYSHSGEVVRRALVVLRSWAPKVLPQLVQVACDPTHPCRPEILAEIDTMVIFIEPRELNLLFSLTTDTDEEVKTGAAYAIAKWCVWQPPSVSEGIATTNRAVQEALKEFPLL